MPQSPDPNVAIEPDGHTLRTVRDIAAGEELPLDYLVPRVPAAYLDSAEGQLLRRVSERNAKRWKLVARASGAVETTP